MKGKQIMSTINCTSFKNRPEMAREFIRMNGIKAAFVWRNGPKDWEVLEGDPELKAGFSAGRFSTRREANALRDEINAIIQQVTA